MRWRLGALVETLDSITYIVVVKLYVILAHLQVALDHGEVVGKSHDRIIVCQKVSDPLLVKIIELEWTWFLPRSNGEAYV